MNLSPANGSTTAQLARAVNAAVFECAVYKESSEGGLFQITTTWTIQPSGSSDRNLIIQSDARFSIGGTATPSGSFSATYRNRLTVVEFTEDLDGAILMCGTAEREEGFFNIRVYSKFDRHHIKWSLSTRDKLHMAENEHYSTVSGII